MMQMFRLLIRHERDKVAQDKNQPNRLREFTYGLIYDSLGWTKRQPTLEDLDIIQAVLHIAEQPVITKEDYMTVRHMLLQSNFNVAPQIEK